MPAIQKFINNHPFELALAFLCFMLPMAFSYAQQLELLSASALQISRGAFVFGFCLFCMGLVWKEFDRDRCSVGDVFLRRLGPFIILAICVLLSVFLNQVTFLNLAQASLQIVFIFCLMICVPLWRYRYELRPLSQAFVWFTAICLCFTVVYYYLGEPANTKLIFPVNIDKLLLLSWGLCLFYLQWRRIAFVFAVALLWSGSFCEIGLMALFYAIMLLPFVKGSIKHFLVKAIVWPALSIVVLAAVNLTTPHNVFGAYQTVMYHIAIRFDYSVEKIPSVLRSAQWEEEIIAFIQDREEQKERKRIYTLSESLKQAQQEQKLLLGYGREVKIERVSVGKPTTVHNSFIYLILRYGILFSLTAHVLWFIYWFPRRIAGDLDDWQRREYVMKCFIFVSMSVIALTHALFWTNMSNAAMLFSVLFLTPPIQSKGLNKT